LTANLVTLLDKLTRKKRKWKPTA